MLGGALLVVTAWKPVGLMEELTGVSTEALTLSMGLKLLAGAARSAMLADVPRLPLAPVGHIQERQTGVMN